MRRALAFLTPLGGAAAPSPSALAWFPVVGAAMGLALGAVWWGVARLWAPYAATLVIDEADDALAGAVEDEGIRCVVAPTVMHGPPEAAALARTVLGAGAGG